MNAETRRVQVTARNLQYLLQWGRVLMNAETLHCAAGHPWRKGGFNGAAFS